MCAMNKEEGHKEGMESEGVGGRRKRGMRVILTRNEWWERGGGGECKHSYYERVSYSTTAWFFRFEFDVF